MQPYCTASIFSVRLSIPPSSPPSFHSFAPPRLLVLARRVHQHRIVLALALGRLVLGLFVQLLHELGLDLAAALLPPGLFSVGLGEDLVELGAEFVVLGDFVGGLEDGWAPVGGEGVGLRKLVRYRFEDVSFELARPKAREESNSQMLESQACEASSVRGRNVPLLLHHATPPPSPSLLAQIAATDHHQHCRAATANCTPAWPT